MKKHNQKNRRPRNQKPLQNAKELASRHRMSVPERLPRPKLLAQVQIMRDDAITIPRAEYDMLANNARLIDMAEQLCKCSSYYTAATFLRHMFKSCMIDNLDDAPGMDTLVTLDRAEYDNLNRVTGLLNALIAVSKRSSNFELNSLVEMLFCGGEKVDKG